MAWMFYCQLLIQLHVPTTPYINNANTSETDDISISLQQPSIYTKTCFFFPILSYGSFWKLLVRCTWNVAALKATIWSWVHSTHNSNFVLLPALVQLIRVFWDIITYHRAGGSPWQTVIPEDLNDHEQHHENPKSHIHIAVWNTSVQLLTTQSSKPFNPCYTLEVPVLHSGQR